MAEQDLFQTGSRGEEVNIKATLYQYVRYWYWFLVGIIVCGAGAYLYLQYTTPLYYVSSTLLIKDENNTAGLSGEGSSFSGLNIFGSSINISNEIEILKSRSLMERVFTDLSLSVSYYIESPFRYIEVYGEKSPIKVITSRLDSAAFGASMVVQPQQGGFLLSDPTTEGEFDPTLHKFGQEISSPYGTFTIVANHLPISEEKIFVQFHSPSALADAYSAKLGVSTVNDKASVLNLSMVDAVPQKAVDILSKLIERYKQEAIDDKNQMASNTIEFIDERLKYLTAELSDVEKDVEQYKRRNELTDVSSEAQLYLQRASEYNKQLADYEIQIDILNSIHTYLSKEENQFELVPSTLSIQDPTLVGLIAKFNELQLERGRILRTTQPNNPIVLSVNEQVSNLRNTILENLRNIKNGLQITRNNFVENSQQFESRIQKVPMMERELLEINRQQSIKQNLYLFLLTKREESALSLASTVSNSRVIDPPVESTWTVSPNRRSILLTAIMLGLGLPFAIIYLKEMLNNKVALRKEVERATQTPILGEVIHSDVSSMLQVTAGSHSSIAEMFRLIRANLQFATLGKENKVILVTSSRSGEGKTFFSINLGASLALSGKKVIIISFDLRKPKLMRNLYLQDHIGITNYLISDDFSVESLAAPVKEVPGLFAMSSGPIPPNPAELMLGEKVNTLMSELRKQYDYVIVDSSPVGQVADTFNLAPYVDSTIYIVRYNYTFKEQLPIVEDIYQHNKLQHPMVVLNDARKKNSNGYGYGYGYGYSNGNGVKEKRRKVAKRT